ncbi:Csu type fimbrial protein [Ralstonia pseudosolanacearum]|uniref:Csu type fimbrial protein n=1 Tax=Ralstonia pseudosolanacearum TaxID=1310165 RepID=UPI003D2C0C04
MKRLILAISRCAWPIILGGAAGKAGAQTTASFNVTLTITANCTIAATPLAFGNVGVLRAPVSATSTLTVTCTNSTPYTVGLNAGTGAGNTEASRNMFGTAAGNTATAVAYQLYKPDLTTVWGDTTIAARVGDTGTGSAQTLTVNGKVPAQQTPAPDTYSSTVTATVYF